MNPLLAPDHLPQFDRITPEQVAPAIDSLLQTAEQALQTVTAADFPARWEALAATLDVATERLSVAWGAVSHLNSVNDSPALRAAYNEALPRVTEFWTRLGADERLYAKYKAMDPAALNPEQRQAHKNAMRNFVLGGAELSVRRARALPKSKSARLHWAKSSAKTPWTRPTHLPTTPAPTNCKACPKTC